jgi:exopolysaccharide biosynthesis polyprenyl glycosylphosphotransferase
VLRVVFDGEAAGAGTVDQCCPMDGSVPGLPDRKAAASFHVRIGQGEWVAPEAARLHRMFDVAVAGVLLVACTPLFALIAMVSKLLQPGPVFYRQERVGRNGRHFQMLKFRSMRVDAERNTGPVFAVGNDPRCTRLGKWLRRSCCDELPQLLNVIRGEMSLVGPRPERPCFVDQFRVSIPRYDERHSVRPGITGWAQVNGWRGDTEFEERLQFDLEYLRRRSLLFDVQILLRTPEAILRPKRISRAREATLPFPGQAGPRAFEIGTGSRSDGVQFEPVSRRAA